MAEYEYDGAKRRTLQKSYENGTLDETRHLYYTEPSKWQVIEERVDSDTAPDRQFVWGLRYIDDLILRDRDTNDNGTLNERLYALQDANWNCTSIADTSGAVQQRFNYTAYGTPGILTAVFAAASNSHDGETLYTGFRQDHVSDLFNVRHRVYAPNCGNWAQRDPVGYDDSISLYEYVHSNPTNNTDPLGLGVCGLPDSFSDDWLIRHVLTLTPAEMVALRKCLRKKNTKLWERFIKAEKFAKIRNAAKRKGSVCGKLVKVLFLVQCESLCVGLYGSCVNDAIKDHQDCVDAARDASEIALCNTIVALDLTECAATYVACGLACLLPINL